MGKRLLYAMLGVTAGFVVFWLLGDLKGRHNVVPLFLGSVAGANLALWIARRAGKIGRAGAPGSTTLFTGRGH